MKELEEAYFRTQFQEWNVPDHLKDREYFLFESWLGKRYEGTQDYDHQYNLRHAMLFYHYTQFQDEKNEEENPPGKS